MSEPNLDGVLTALGLLESYLSADRDEGLVEAFVVLVPQLGPTEAVEVIGTLLAVLKGFLSLLDPNDVRAFIDEYRRSALEGEL